MTDHPEREDSNSPELPQCCAPGRAAFAPIVRPRAASTSERPLTILLGAEDVTNGVAPEK